jgi:hypothetical protein
MICFDKTQTMGLTFVNSIPNEGETAGDQGPNSLHQETMAGGNRRPEQYAGWTTDGCCSIIRAARAPENQDRNISGKEYQRCPIQ